MGKIKILSHISAAILVASACTGQGHAAGNANSYQNQPYNYRLMRFWAYVMVQAEKNDVLCASTQIGCHRVGEEAAASKPSFTSENAGLSATGVPPETLKAQSAAQVILGMITSATDAEYPKLTSAIESTCSGALAYVIENLPPDINNLKDKNLINTLDGPNNPCMIFLKNSVAQLKSRGAIANGSNERLNGTPSKNGLNPILPAATGVSTGTSTRTTQ